MLADVGLGELLWSLLVLFVMIQYLIVTFTVIVDVFRSQDLSGMRKAVWLIALLVFPVISLITYLIARGDGMGLRDLDRERRAQNADAIHIPPPPAGPASELQIAKSLLDSGAITTDDYERLKARLIG